MKAASVFFPPAWDQYKYSGMAPYYHLYCRGLDKNAEENKSTFVQWKEGIAMLEKLPSGMESTATENERGKGRCSHFPELLQQHLHSFPEASLRTGGKKETTAKMFPQAHGKTSHSSAAAEVVSGQARAGRKGDTTGANMSGDTALGPITHLQRKDSSLAELQKTISIEK